MRRRKAREEMNSLKASCIFTAATRVSVRCYAGPERERRSTRKLKPGYPYKKGGAVVPRPLTTCFNVAKYETKKRRVFIRSTAPALAKQVYFSLCVARREAEPAGFEPTHVAFKGRCLNRLATALRKRRQSSRRR